MADQASVRTDYREIAAAGVGCGIRDALGRERDPGARFEQLRAATRRLKAAGDPVALRLFEYAYAFAFAHARLRGR
jgi:hypothetical protein